MSTPRHSITVVTPPAAEPVSVAMAKAQCRVEHAADDDLLTRWIKAAREMVEAASDRRIGTQTVRVDFAEVPAGTDPLALPVWPVQAVTAVSYKRQADGADTPLIGYQSWPAHQPPLVAPPVGQDWPAVDARHLTPLSVTVTAGSPVTPGYAVQAILLTVGYWYGFRGDGKDPAAVEAIPGEAGLPAGAVRLIDLLAPKRYG